MKTALFFLIFFSNLNDVLAQSDGDSLQEQSILQMMMVEKNIVGENSFIYSGREYTGYDHQLDGHPFLFTDSMTGGSIYYNGSVFRDIRMLYDIHLDEIILYNAYKKQVISLPDENIDSFRLFNHLFIWIVADSSNSRTLKTGFYHLPYSGNSTVYIRQVKTIEIPLNARLPSQYVQKTSYFIRNKGIYYRVESQNGLLDVFSDKKKQVSKWLRSNKLKFRKQPENTLVSAATYYDQLN